MTPIEEYYHYKEEPVKSCLLALRKQVLQLDSNITEAWKYRMPFFCYKGKMFCYLWVHKKTLQPYIGIVEGRQIEHPLLIQEERARMKIMLFNAEEDLPVKTLSKILKQALALYK